jgi:hypothetical protein
MTAVQVVVMMMMRLTLMQQLKREMVGMMMMTWGREAVRMEGVRMRTRRRGSSGACSTALPSWQGRRHSR